VTSVSPVWSRDVGRDGWAGPVSGTRGAVAQSHVHQRWVVRPGGGLIAQMKLDHLWCGGRSSLCLVQGAVSPSSPPSSSRIGKLKSDPRGLVTGSLQRRLELRLRLLW
jgi:hypothetical protein